MLELIKIVQTSIRIVVGDSILVNDWLSTATDIDTGVQIIGNRISE